MIIGWKNKSGQVFDDLTEAIRVTEKHLPKKYRILTMGILSQRRKSNNFTAKEKDSYERK